MFERVYAMHREAGMPISALYPFRDSFYERMGYAGFPKPRFLTLNPEALAPLVRLDMRGTCEQVAMKDGFNEWRAFLERYQAQTHGFALKHVTNARRWQDDNAWWLAMARDDDGEIVGAMTYKITGYTEKLIASTFYTTSATGRYQLLDWVGRHADQVKEAILELRPDDYPEIWFRDLEASVTCGIDHAWPAPMARVIDVARLTGIGAGSGEIALTIEDAHCPWNADTFTFRGDGDTLTVEPGGEAAATLTIQGLSALVFSGRDPATFPFRGWGAPDVAAAESLRAIFPCAIPDIHETF
jgi:predicted acetyltransferase